MTGDLLITIGLSIDIIGAGWLYSHAIKLNKKKVNNLSETVVQQNEQLKQFFLFHARDARIGVSILAIGFLLQIVGVWYPFIRESYGW